MNQITIKINEMPKYFGKLNFITLHGTGQTHGRKE